MRMETKFHNTALNGPPKAEAFTPADKEREKTYKTLSFAITLYRRVVAITKPEEPRHVVAKASVEAFTEAQTLLMLGKEKQAIRVMNRANQLIKDHIDQARRP